MEKISERLKLVVDCQIDQRARFKQLEAMSGIPSDHWKNFWHGRQRAHEEFIQFVARQWPEYAFWLVTGIEDENYGHVRPTPDDRLSPRSITGEALAKRIEINERYYSLDANAAWSYKSASEKEALTSQAIRALESAASSNTDEHASQALKAGDTLLNEVRDLDAKRAAELVRKN